MITFFTIGTVILVISSFAIRTGKAKLGLFVSFILIFLFLALRYNYGNDYPGYLDQFNRINIHNFQSLIPYRDLGWLTLIILFKPLGFFSMVIFLAFVNCVIYYRLIVRYVDRSYYWLALLIYFFDSNFLLIHLSAMRQSLSIAIFLISLQYILQKKYLVSAALILLSLSFHASALLLFPVIFISILTYKVRLGRINIGILLASFVLLFIFGYLFKPMLLDLVKSVFGYKYLVYLKLSGSKPPVVNIISYLGLLFVILFYYNRLDNEYKFLANLLVIGFFIIPISYVIPLSIRLAYYFLPISILMYPHLLVVIKPILTKQIFVLAIIVIIFVRLITFVKSPTYGPYYTRYKTIFSTIRIFGD